MPRLRYPIVLFDAGETLVGPRVSFGAVYARVLAGFGVDADAGALERALRLCWADTNAALPPGVDRYGAHPEGENGYWLRFVEGTLERTPGLDDPRGLAAKALAPLRDAFRDPDVWTVYDDVVPTLEALREAGARLAVVSNWDSGLPRLLERLDLARWFDTLVVSHLEGLEKPRPEIFLRAVDRLGGEPAHAIHVGDVPELDEAGARAAGIASVIVDRRGRYGAPGRVTSLSSVIELARG